MFLRKQKNGKTWSVCWKSGERSFEKSTGETNYHAAMKIAGRMLPDIERGPYSDPKKILFRDFAKLWEENFAKGRVRESSLTRYKELINIHLIPHFGNSLLENIRIEDIQRYLSQKAKDAEITPSTINRSRTVLHAMLKCGVEWNYLRENPVSHTKPLKEPEIEMDFLSCIPQEIPGLSEKKSEIDLFLEAVPQEHYALFLTLILTGLRAGESLAMKWQNVDWNRSQYFVRESLRQGKFTEPKTPKSKRAVDLPPALVDTLKAHKAEQNQKRLLAGDSWNDNDLVFPSPTGGPRDICNLDKRVFKPALSKAKIRRIRIHDLRHTNVALRIMNGEHPKRIQQQLGHSSIEVTLDRYGHLMEETNPQAAINLQALVLGNPKPAQQATPQNGEIEQLRIASGGNRVVISQDPGRVASENVRQYWRARAGSNR